MLFWKGKAKDIQNDTDKWKEFKLMVEGAMIKANTNEMKIDELHTKLRGINTKIGRLKGEMEEEEETENNKKNNSLGLGIENGIESNNRNKIF